MSYILIVFYFGAKKANKLFDTFDEGKVVYSEKGASGYSMESFRTRNGGSSKLLHILITPDELVFTSYFFVLFVAKRSDLLHRVPIKSIESLDIEKGRWSPKLHVKFKNERGESKDVVVVSSNIDKIKSLLEELKSSNNP